MSERNEELSQHSAAAIAAPAPAADDDDELPALDEMDAMNGFLAGVGEMLAADSPERYVTPSAAAPPPDAVRTYQLRADAPVKLSGEDWEEREHFYGGAAVRLAHMADAGTSALSDACMGLHCWESAARLCEYMAERASLFARHDSVIELGAGPGLVGLVNHALHGGAERQRTVVLTDGHAAAVALLAKNVGLNVADEEVHVARLRWGHADDLAALPLRTYACVLAADCTFSERLNPSFVQTVAALLAPGGLFVLAVASRTALLLPQIAELCAAHGLRLVEPSRLELLVGRPPTDAGGGGGWILRFERPRDV